VPLLFRAMLIADGKPAVGPTATALGVRPGHDLPVAAGDAVRPGTGGMSVNADWKALPSHRIPIRLRHLVPKAAGKNVALCCWRMGDGPFQAGPVAGGLALRVDPRDGRHGLVEPDREMTLAEYQATLAATREYWERIDEDRP
jgi:hypothetical protein